MTVELFDINQAMSLLELTLDELQDLVDTGRLETTDEGLITADSLDLYKYGRNVNA